MNKAHVESLQLFATPFRKDTPRPFAFGPGSTWAGITAEIRESIRLCYSIVSRRHHGKRTHSTGAYTGSLPRASVDQPCQQQKVKRWIFAGVEVTGDGGLPKVVGWCHRELQILYGFMT